MLALLLLLLVAATRQTVSQLNITQKQLLLDLHNQARSSASPAATNMERMVRKCMISEYPASMVEIAEIKRLQ